MAFIVLVFLFAAAYAATYLLLLAGSLLAHLVAGATGRRLPPEWFSARRIASIACWVALAVVACDVGYLLVAGPSLY